MSTKKYQHNEKSLGGRLRKFRKSKGDDVVVFSKLLNISQGSLSAYENNKTIISSEAIINLVQNTDINIDWLLTGKGEMIRQGVENDTSIGKAGDPLGADPEVVDFLKMTRAVLESGTAYSDTLITNIRSHHQYTPVSPCNGNRKTLKRIRETPW